MFKPTLFRLPAPLVAGLVARLLRSRWVRDYNEYHGACEVSCSARLGPLTLETNDCFVLDHADAGLSLRLPTGRGTLCLGYLACRGEDAIRRPGFYAYWQKRPLKVVHGGGQDRPGDPFPF